MGPGQNNQVAYMSRELNRSMHCRTPNHLQRKSLTTQLTYNVKYIPSSGQEKKSPTFRCSLCALFWRIPRRRERKLRVTEIASTPSLKKENDDRFAHKVFVVHWENHSLTFKFKTDCNSNTSTTCSTESTLQK
jgi:hypothetical protein